ENRVDLVLLQRIERRGSADERNVALWRPAEFPGECERAEMCHRADARESKPLPFQVRNAADARLRDHVIHGPRLLSEDDDAGRTAIDDDAVDHGRSAADLNRRFPAGLALHVTLGDDDA